MEYAYGLADCMDGTFYDSIGFNGERAMKYLKIAEMFCVTDLAEKIVNVILDNNRVERAVDLLILSPMSGIYGPNSLRKNIIKSDF